MFGRTVAAAACGLLLTSAPAPVLAACTITKTLELPVTMSGLLPLVPTKINGVDERFVLDSGAFFSAISPALVAKLKLPGSALPETMRIAGIGGTDLGAYLVTANNLTIAGKTAPNIQFLVISGADEYGGLLGQNVLGAADAEYDLAGGAVRLFKAEGCPAGQPMAYWAKGVGYSVLNIDRLDRFDPHIIGEAFVNGARITVMFDTGVARSMITRDAAQRSGIKLDSPNVRPAEPTRGIGPDNVKTWIAPVESFKIGGEEIKYTFLRVGDFKSADMVGDMILERDHLRMERIQS